MLTEEQIDKINDAFRHGSTLVFQIEGRGVFISDLYIKHRKNKTIEMKECYEVNESCFSGDNYYGDTCGPRRHFIFTDPYSEADGVIATIYYVEDIVKAK